MTELERVVIATDANVKAVEARNKPLVAQLKEVRDQLAEFTQRQREIGVSSRPWLRWQCLTIFQVEAEEAVGEHVRAQNNEKHYQAQLESSKQP